MGFRNHTVTVDEIAELLGHHVTILASSTSSRERTGKFLNLHGTDRFVVTSNGQIVYSGVDLSAAVEAYNSATGGAS